MTREPEPDYGNLPLMTPERIRYNTAHRAKLRTERAYREARAAVRDTGEEYRAAIAEEFSALKALQASLREGYRHGTDTD